MMRAMGRALSLCAALTPWLFGACAVPSAHDGAPTVSPQQTAKIVAPPFMDHRPSVGPVGDPVLPVPRTTNLDNGIPLYVVSKRDLPLVQVAVVVRAGVGDDPQPGVACLTAAMLPEGAGSRDALNLSAAVEQIGATLSSDCAWRWTTVSVRVLERNLDRALDLLADVVLRPRFAADAFTRVTQRLRGHALARRADPARVADLAYRAAVFGRHPYGWPRLPRPADLDRLRLAPLAAFYRAKFRHDRVFIVAVGDLDLASIAPGLSRRFGGWHSSPAKRGPSMSRLSAEVSPSSQRRRLVLVDRPGASQSVLRVGHRTAGRRTADYPAFVLLNVVLGGSFTSRLNQNLRERHGYAYGAHSHWWLRRDLGLFSVAASVETKATVPALEQIVRELRGLAGAPVTAAELAKAKNLAIEGLSDQVETVDALATAVARHAMLKLPLDTLPSLVPRLRRLDAAALMRVARARFDADNPTIVVVGDMQRLAPKLTARYGPAVRFDEDGQPIRAASSPRSVLDCGDTPSTVVKCAGFSQAKAGQDDPSRVRGSR